MDRSALAEQIAQAVQRRVGSDDPTVARIVAEELQLALAEPVGQLRRPGAEADTSKIVVTAHGRNRSGVVARLAAAIDELGGDIRDLSQTIVGDYFTMLFVVHLSGGGPEEAQFMRLRQRLKQVGEDLGVHVVVMHDDILSSMHSI